MFRARTLCGLGLALMVALALIWCQPPIEAGPPDDGKERTPAELIVGTWNLLGSNGQRPDWLSGGRITYRVDGSWRQYSNRPLGVVWLTDREGRYEVIGKVVRHHYELTPEDEAENRRTAPTVYLTGSFDREIIAVSRDELTVLTPSGSGRYEIPYRRIK